MRFCAQCAGPEDCHADNPSPDSTPHEFIPYGEQLELLRDAYQRSREHGIKVTEREWFSRLHTYLSQICGKCGHWLTEHFDEPRNEARGSWSGLPECVECEDGGYHEFAPMTERMEPFDAR